MRDKVVIITGASSGIGKALAYELAHQGAKVVLAARNIEELLHIEQDLRQQGAEVLSVRTDVRLTAEYGSGDSYRFRASML